MQIWPDRLRNLATLMIITIHVAAPIAEQYQDLNTWWWWAGNFWNSVSRCGVPLFVMLSGYLLLGKDYPTGEFLSRRITRVVVPGLFWMIVYMIYDHIANGQPATFADAAKTIVEGPVHYHLWFIYLIIGLYTAYPILRPWARHATDGEFYYLFTACAIAAWGYKILFTFFHVGLGIYWEFFTNNIGYFVLGYYLGTKPIGPKGEQNGLLKNWQFSENQLIGIGFAFVVLGTAATMLGAFWTKSAMPADTHRYFWDYLTPNVGACAIGWFLVARFAFERLPMIQFERELAAASFGIYLIHILCMDWWGMAGYWHSKWHPLKGIPLLVCLVWLMSFLWVSVIRVLPFGKKIT